MPLTCYRGLFVGDFWAKLSECFSKDLGPQKFNSLSYHKGHLGGFWVGLWPSRPSHPFLAHFVVLQPIRLDHLTPKHFFFWGNGPRTHLMVQLLKSHNSPLGCVWTWGMPKYTNRIAIVTGRKWWSTSRFCDRRETPGTVRSVTEGLQGEGDSFWQICTRQLTISNTEM